MEMTRRDRDDLIRVVKQREKLAKSGAEARAAEVLADFEEQLARQYKIEESEVFLEALGVVQQAIREADAMVNREFDRMGVDPAFAGGLDVGYAWQRRGENALKERRHELRAVAKSRVDAMTKAALVHIAKESLERQTELIAGSLETKEARAYVNSMPTIESLVPNLTLDDVKDARLPAAQRRQLLYRSRYGDDE